MSAPLANTEEHIPVTAPADSPTRLAQAHPHVQIYTGLEKLPHSFQNLFEKSGREDFFLTLPWFQNFVETAMAPEDRARIYAAVDTQATPAGMLLMRSSTSHSNSFSSLRKLESLSNYYSCFFAPHIAGRGGDFR